MGKRDGNKMRDWHRVFLQKVMSQGYMSGKEIFVFAMCLVEKFDGMPGFPKINLGGAEDEKKAELAELIDDLYTTTNEALEKINFQIKRGCQEVKEDDTYEQCYAFVPLEENQQIAKCQKIFSEQELEYLKTICHHLATEKIATEMKLINLCMQVGISANRKKLSTIEASRVVRSFVSHGYLVNNRKHSRAKSSGGTYHLGARLILELETWLKDNIEADLCRACKKVVFVSVECPMKNCDNVYHRQCAESKPKCRDCKQPLKIDGVATKR
eukprot:TRINITY_DN12100_c0_g1_i1.p1 TRINITY_DN12100_c0_g1~~TRINITY_DN12100_c0_g1_i1.p1  ORF type:complete len:280 (+),score=63.65 TRINITY_DN12100_c0_g1_i1:32-841(+)